VDEINKTSHFTQDEIHEHKMVGHKLFPGTDSASWDTWTTNIATQFQD